MERVTIDIRKSKDRREYVIQFEKSKGVPSSVYFFFDSGCHWPSIESFLETIVVADLLIGPQSQGFSAIRTKMMPNHMASNPRPITNGKKIGIVSTVIAATSRKQPRKK